MSELFVDSGGVRLAVEDVGEGIPVVLLHGLTATRRYVVMGSRTLERSGHRVVTYDARGHGASLPTPDPVAYRYEDLAADLTAVMDALEIPRAVLAGASMGAHTLLRLALDVPERVLGLVVITPAFEPGHEADPERLAHWDALAEGLRSGGIDGFLAAYGDPGVPEEMRETVLRVIAQRLSRHERPWAVADALSAVPRSRPFAAMSDLTRIAVPVTVVASNDEDDPSHPQAVGEAYARAIPGAELVTDRPGHSPVAWQGTQLSHVIAAVASEVGSRG